MCTTPTMKLENNIATYCNVPETVDYTNFSKRMQKYIDFCFNEAYLHDGAAKSKIASLLVFRNKPIAIGYNSMKTHPMQAKFGKNPDAICIHAEIDCIRKASFLLKSEDFKKATMIVMRAKRDGSWGLARPCISKNGQGCQMAISVYQIGTVIYSTDYTGKVSYL